MNTLEIFELKNKTAIVTGAASGIGKGIAKAFCSLGCNVVIVDVNNDAINAALKEFGTLPGKLLGIKCDITDSEQVKNVVEKTIEEFGSIEILVNNAGIGRRAKAEDMTDEEWDSVIDVNLKGSFFFCREVGKKMISQGKGGKIINIASIAAIVGVETGNANYSASKGGIVAMARCLAVEWAKHKILVNTIIPTHIKTPLIEDLIKQKPETGQYFLNNILLGRLGEIEDLIGPAIFLASKASDFITGQLLVVDGGHTAK